MSSNSLNRASTDGRHFDLDIFEEIIHHLLSQELKSVKLINSTWIDVLRATNDPRIAGPILRRIEDNCVKRPGHLSPNSGERLVESIMEPLTVRIDGLGLTKPVIWWAETDDPRDEWIQRFNENVAEVLVPVIQAWKVGSQRIRQDQGQSLCRACRLQGTH
ncbi:hypothetical protein F5Y08DRAFT_344813 [Xylaria arbuscula]|nr:hypothetical protein F5Y08DRAFT_344813 [Xylaria arbuscula]